MNQQCQKLSVHKNFSLGRLKLNSYLWQLPAYLQVGNVMIFFFIFKLPGKVTRQTYFKLITYRFSHGPTWTSQSSPTRAWNANQGAWVLCILMMEQSLFVSLNGGGGGRAGHKWQALSKGGRRHEKNKKIKIKIFEAVGSFDYRFDYLVLSAEFSCSNNNNRSKKYIIYHISTRVYCDGFVPQRVFNWHSLGRILPPTRE